MDNHTTNPEVDQRVELIMVTQDLPTFFLSGKVVQVKAPPKTSLRPMQHCKDVSIGNGSMRLSEALVPRASGDCSNIEMIDLSMLHWGRFCKKCTGIHMPRMQWEQQVPKEAKEEALKKLELWDGVIHGQEVVCAVRLNYNWDMQRGNDEGPWDDGIPFDGRDVWQVTLIADDSKSHYWVYKPGSLVNLGRDRFPRCWPWSDVNESPYERDGVDRLQAGDSGISFFSPDWPFVPVEEFTGPATDIEGLLRSKARGKLVARVDNESAAQMQMIHRTKFLRNRVLAHQGQRVEVTFKVRDLASPLFILSGKVIEVKPTPMPMNGIRPMENCTDRFVGNGSMDLSGFLVPWIACPACGIFNCRAAVVNHDKLPWGDFCKECGGIHGTDWEQAPERIKEKALKEMLRLNANFHGQEVVCAVRLNYNWDMRRGSDAGPWNDGIPFDGRDVWQLTLSLMTRKETSGISSLDRSSIWDAPISLAAGPGRMETSCRTSVMESIASRPRNLFLPPTCAWARLGARSIRIVSWMSKTTTTPWIVSRT